MSSDQLKAIVIEKILYEQNEATLQDLLNILTSRSPQEVTLSPEQRTAIEAGMADYAAGRFVTEEDLDRHDTEWR